MAERKRPAGKAAPKRKIRSKKMINSLLVAAAREEFGRCGYMGATTAAIARKADVTETQLFRHFPSKADLFRAAVFEPLAEHFEQFNLRHPIPTGADAGDRELAHLYVGELQELLDEHSKLLLSLVVAQIFQTGDLKHFDPVDSLEEYFTVGAKLMSHRLDKASGVEPELLARVSFAGLMGCVLFKDWFIPPGLGSEKQVNSAVVKFMLEGIAMGEPAAKPESGVAGKSKPARKKTVRKTR